MPRFVVLEHDHPVLHWDLMLETGDILATWRLRTPPVRGSTFEAERSFDHRLVYLDYEGPVSGDRGRVVGWDRGMLVWQVREEGCIRARLEGQRVRGLLRLDRLPSGTWQGNIETEGQGGEPETAPV